MSKRAKIEGGKPLLFDCIRFNMSTEGDFKPLLILACHAAKSGSGTILGNLSPSTRLWLDKYAKWLKVNLNFKSEDELYIDINYDDVQYPKYEMEEKKLEEIL